MQPQIFLSYSWKNTDIADELDEDWKKIGLVFIRDVRDAGYKQNLNQFMLRVHESNFVLLLISKAYLESKNCMYEALEVFDNPDFARKILPILTSDAQIGNTLTRLSYIEYWQAEAKVLEKALKRTTVSPAITASIADDLRQVTKIVNSFDAFASAIKGILYASWPDVKNNGYQAIFKHIGYTPGETAILQECSRIIALDDTEDQENALAPLQAEHPENVYVLFAESTIAYNEKKYKKTQRLLEKIIALYPRFELAHFNLGVLLNLHQQDYEGARQAFERAVQVNPTSGMAHLALGHLLQRQFNDYSTARTHLELAILINPQDAAAHQELALLLSNELGDHTSARPHFEQALALDPQPLYHYNFAKFLGHYLKDYVAEIEQYERAIALQPTYSSAHNNLAIVLKDEFGDNERALYHFERAVEADPTNAEAQSNLASSLLTERQDHAAARQHYEAALAIKPDYVRVIGLYANLLDEYFGEHELARKLYEQVLEFDPTDVPIRQRLATLLQNYANDFAGAVQHLKHVLLLRPGDATAHYNLAIGLGKAGDIDNAICQYERALELDSQFLVCYLSFGQLLANTVEDQAGARRIYEKGLLLFPDEASLHRHLGLSLRQLPADYQRARFHLEQAIELDPTIAANYQNLAILLSDYFDEPVLARTYFEQGVQVEPEDAIARMNFAGFLLNQEEIANAQTHYAIACKLNPVYKTAEYDEIFRV
jgi:tetratricopeptide (TPR) repeat protein